MQQRDLPPWCEVAAPVQAGVEHSSIRHARLTCIVLSGKEYTSGCEIARIDCSFQTKHRLESWADLIQILRWAFDHSWTAARSASGSQANTWLRPVRFAW